MLETPLIAFIIYGLKIAINRDNYEILLYNSNWVVKRVTGRMSMGIEEVMALGKS